MKIVIEPVTRIEGHAKITIHLDEQDQVAEARFHVTEFRGFEKFCEGRPVWEMPGLTSRICGICPVSHMLASAKAGDGLLGVPIPPAAERLRRLINLAQIVQSHALSFFHMSAPDLLLGMDSDPGKRNLVGLVEHDREFVRRGIRLRQFGQSIIEALGGRKVHPAWAVPGGVRSGLAESDRCALLARLPDELATAEIALQRFLGLLDGFSEEVAHFGDFPSLFLGLVGSDGSWEHYGGELRLIDALGNVVSKDLDPAMLAEAEEGWSYLKSPYYEPLGYPGGSYRVGPLARLNVCEQFSTPRAQAHLSEYRQRGGRTVSSSFFYHYARLIEIVAGLESIERLLSDSSLSDPPLRSRSSLNRLFSIGISEAPRGTLFHRYRIDEHGVLQHVDLMIATGQNNQAMNQTVTQIARRWVRSRTLPEGVCNRLEAGIRAYDPCLSCSTHALGQMPLHVSLLDHRGSLLGSVKRA